MRKQTGFLVVAALFVAFTFISNLQAQPLVNIETVTVGDAGNAADVSTGYGAVADEFKIGKYEVTISQYSTFLNSVASVTSDSYVVNLWNTNMATDLNVAGISRSGSGIEGNPYSYSGIGSGNRPIAYVSWFDAARFANWMNNGATNGASTETGAYTLNGASNGTVLRNPDAVWFIPSEDEWVKSAYYKAGGTNSGYWEYPTQSDAAPGNSIGGLPNQANARTNGYFAVTQATNLAPGLNYLTDAGAFSDSAGPYGTFDQAGNVVEWTEGITPSTTRVLLGGHWVNDTQSTALGDTSTGWPYDQDQSTGFRLATVPEPSTYALLLMTAAGALWCARKRRPKVRALIPVVAVLFVAFNLISNLYAQPLVNIETVTVGDPGNAADTTGYGAVADVFAMGKYEVTIEQYTAFLNAVAATDTYSLYNPRMATDLNIAGITQAGSSGSFSYSALGSGTARFPT
jgi:formylglycine-generating enzyme